MNIDLKPGDRFRATEADRGHLSGLSVTAIYEGTVYAVVDDRVFYGVGGGEYLMNGKNVTWERLAPAEPKNLGAVVEFTSAYAETVRVVLVGPKFENSLCSYTWDDILEEDANPRVLHEGWDGK